MMSESTMWGYLKRTFGPYGDFMRVEDGINMGVPDVNYCICGVEGWIELKEIHDWPIRQKTPVKFRWTKEQRLWARRRIYADGNVWLLLHVLREKRYLLFPCWRDLSKLGLELNKVEVEKLAMLGGIMGLPLEDTLKALSRGALREEGDF